MRRNYLWVVEELYCGDWVSWPSYAASTRKKARKLQADMKIADRDIVTRVRQYLRREI